MRQRTVRAGHGVIGAAFVVAGIVLAGPAGAGTRPIVPVSWCAHQGSNAATGATPVPQPYPNTPPDTSTDGILWRRHERVTDNIYTPQVQLTFRSAINNPFSTDPSAVHFPVITDQVTSSGGNSQVGDVMGPADPFGTGADTEFRKVWDQCRNEWLTKYKRQDGIFAVNINRFIDTSGNRTGLGGFFGFFDPPGDPIYAGGGLLVDNNTRGSTNQFFTFNGVGIPLFDVDPADQLLGHELGHALGLDHRSGDDTALMRSQGHSHSLPAYPHFQVDNLSLNATEVATIKATAQKVPGHEGDPPGVITPGDVVGTVDLDESEEHDIPRYLDLDALHVALHRTENLAAFGTELFGPIPDGAVADYWIFVDADGDPDTGGQPANLAAIGGPSTAFRGAEIAIQAHIGGGTCDGPCTPLHGTVWKWSCEGEVPSCSFDTVSFESVFFRLQTMKWFADPGPGCAFCNPFSGIGFHVVSVSIANDLVGLQLGRPFKIQAFALDATGTPQDALDETPGEAGHAFVLGFPDFAHCFPQADAIPGHSVEVVLENLTPSSPIHGLLGPRLVFNGTSDAMGGGTIDLPIPGDTAPGLHLVTVGVDDTAFTADCSVNVIPNTAPTIQCPAAATIECTSASGTPADVKVTVGDVDGDPLTVTLNVGGTDVSTASVSAGGPPTSATPTLSNSYTLGMHTVQVSVSDGINDPVSCSTTVKIQDTKPPVLTCTVTMPVLTNPFPPNHNLVNVGLNASATDRCASPTATVRVFGDEDDQEATGDGTASPDARDIAPITLRLRDERKANSDGRVYLIVARAADPSGNGAVKCCTVGVPHDLTRPGLRSITGQAAAAADFCAKNGGAAPAGYFVVGDGPVVGSKQ